MLIAINVTANEMCKSLVLVSGWQSVAKFTPIPLGAHFYQPVLICFTFWFLVCYADTQLATQVQQRRIHVVRSNKVARKRLTKSNGTPAMDLGHFNVVVK